MPNRTWCIFSCNYFLEFNGKAVNASCFAWLKQSLKDLKISALKALLSCCFITASGSVWPQGKMEIPDHSPWNKILQEYVSEQGRVAYEKMINQREELDTYVTYLESFSPDLTWPKSRYLAYYINLYNAGTVQLILNHYPVKSIQDLKDPWGQKLFQLHGGALSLDDIEHKILRPLQDPRIHFALNCASISCPKLKHRAYTELGLEKELNDAVGAIFTNPNLFQNKKNGIYLSSIFKWYREDFEIAYGTLIHFLNKYHDLPFDPETKIHFLPYNWALNASQ